MTLRRRVRTDGDRPVQPSGERGVVVDQIEGVAHPQGQMQRVGEILDGDPPGAGVICMAAS
ncbi:MAG: hypothetical protein HZY73_01630 [Micropruina sp.]|nr:MAG: hypothetical protein HZY73_01630 [Micropruina sp.]